MHSSIDKLADFGDSIYLYIFVSETLFRYKFRWGLFLRIPLTSSKYWFRHGFVLHKQQAITLTNDGPV